MDYINFSFSNNYWLLKVFPKVGKYYKSKDFYEIEKNIKYKIEFVFGFLLIFFLSLLSYNKSFYEAILAYWILILNLGKYGLFFFLYIIYSIIFLINIYIRDFIHFLKRIIFKTKDENSNYCIPLINSDSVLTDDPFVLSMLYSIYIDINEEEIKKKEKKSGNSENNFALVYLRLNPSAFLQYCFKEITKNLFLIHNKPMHKNIAN